MRVLFPTPSADAAATPLVVQGNYGLGRITVVAFDLDQSPFLDHDERGEFWDWLIHNAGSQRSSDVQENKVTNPNVYGGYSNTSDNEDEFTAAIRQHVDSFEGVPVISFGWVALFIVLYTLLIGPVEYLFLKKVLGRLELTWVTFPLIVLTVSATAYFTAYAIKGNDLRINKIDVVDIDVGGGRIYGRTWFTIFSPRIDSYTLAVEPREGWAVGRPDVPSPVPLVDWMGGGRGGSRSFVSRGYTYHVDQIGRAVADGLERVPIQVWSTKAFTANWSAYSDRGTPLISSELEHPPSDPGAVAGTITNNLPVGVLNDVALIYAGKFYKLGTVPQGRVTVSGVGLGGGAVGLQTDSEWLAKNAPMPVANQQEYSGFGRSGRNTTIPGSSNLSMWGALFHEKATPPASGALKNASIRELDQSWRVSEDNRDEVILLARIGPVSGLSEEMMTREAESPSPTKLWVKSLPGGTAARDQVPGSMRQETYIRAYIPIRKAGVAK
ncbi:hypothetical protein [Fimbriiglobus ruber]|uniref:hypothetical protein n=1 Tax=Fimbriiglobus ruber TaxID=1908690 RepID=UPI00117A5036|nr:hypothetical protein [Fimbriiglobus ruber]